MGTLLREDEMDVETIRRYVEDYFSKHPLLRPPKHVLVVLDRIALDTLYKRLYFSGLQPFWLPDTIIVSWPLLRQDTLVHETLHTYGCGENCAWFLAPRIAAFRKKFPPLIRRPVHYEICPGYGCRYEELHRMLGSKLVHLIRQP